MIRTLTVNKSFFSKKRKFLFILTTALTIFVCLLCVHGIYSFSEGSDDFFHMYIDDVKVGDFASYEDALEVLGEARRNVAASYDSIVFMDYEMRIESENVLTGDITPKKEAIENARNLIIGSLKSALSPSYTVKMGDKMVTLSAEEDVLVFLNEAIDRYNPGGRFEVRLVHSPGRDFNALTAEVVDTYTETESESYGFLPKGGAGDYIYNQLKIKPEDAKEVSFQDYQTGLISIGFVESIEIAEGYVPSSQIVSLQDAIDSIIKEHESAYEYKVVSGDTLSGISLNLNVPIEEIVALNSDKLENANSTLHVDDTLVITVPEPELSVEHIERNYVDEDYEAEIQIIPRDDWYTTETNVIQQPSAGHHRAIVDQHFINDTESQREVLIEEIDVEAVPKIMERGTKIPPSYIKPIYGGRISSYFGYRTAPTAGATTYHRGIDWATPTGTSVMASSGGVVKQSGWGGSYGYTVLITHPDGTQTRYAHMSRLNVSVGQYVNQGDVIGWSGSTGRSTGPHLHFEILINGAPVNPLNYVPG